MTVTFDSDFDPSALTEDDVDIADDAVDLTTAPDCSGSEQAAVSLALGVLTIQICAGDGGAVAAGSEVTIEIGTQATASGIGANRVANPAADGTYFVTLGGTFGDGGSFAVPILDGSDKTVQATVPTTGGGGGDGGGGGGDVMPPNICCVVVSNITNTSATINWGTDENANSFVDYGLTDSYELGTASEAFNYATTHAIPLSSLTPGTEYHFRVRSADTSGNQAMAFDYTFTTLDSTSPVISNVQVVDITETSARVTWTTNEPATSVVNYGTTIAYGSSASDNSLVTSHSVILTGLTRNTLYHFTVTSVDASNNSASSGDGTFTTLANPAPGNVANLAVVAGDAQLSFTWDNPADGDLAGVILTCSMSGYPATPDEGVEVADTLTETAVYSSLINGTTYYCTAFAYDTLGQLSSGAIISGTPIAPEPEDVCGDALCTGEETPASCPADCAPEEEDVCGDGACTGAETPASCAADCVEGEEDYCGDGACNGDETPATCAYDCAEEEEEGFCGDGECSYLEDSETCPADCPLVEEAVCGNGMCEEEEDSASCPSDCPVEEIPPTTAGELVPQEDVRFFVAEGTIELYADDEGSVDLLGRRPLRVRLETTHLNNTVESVRLVIGQSTYLMALASPTDANADEAYIADVTSPADPLAYAMAVSIFYEDGTSQTLSFIANVRSDGYIYATVDGNDTRVPTTRVTAYRLLGSVYDVWDASPNHEDNPFVVGPDGSFAWYVPAGEYYVRAEKDGYEPADSPAREVGNSILNPVIRLTPIPEEVIEEVPTAPLTFAGVAEDLENISEAINVVRELPGVQTSAEIAAPVIATAVVASTISLAIAFDLLPFLQYLFTAPILFFWRRRRKGFGLVYNAISKVGVDLAIVRMYQMPQNRLVRSRVTDKEGRYFFLSQPGLYRMHVVKPGFVFPSQILAEVKDDGVYLDVYHGEDIEVRERDATITANIPLDPVSAEKMATPSHVRRMKRMRAIQGIVSVVGLVLAVAVAVLRPTWFTILVACVQVAIFLLVRRLATARKPKSWGIVYDKTTGRPLSNAVVRIFEPKYKKLLETQVTDAKGRYSFLLGPSEYFATYEKDGYHPEKVEPIDYRSKSEASELAVDVVLHPANEPEETSQGTSERSHEDSGLDGQTTPKV